MNLDECRQNIWKVETKFAIANRPSDVVSRIHVYVDLHGLPVTYTAIRFDSVKRTTYNCVF